MLHARRLRIVIPPTPSRTLFEPRYFVPLLEARYRPVLPNMEPIEVSEIPTFLRTPGNVWRVFPSIEEEVNRVRNEFSTLVDAYGRPVFDTIYPGEKLAGIIAGEIEDAEDEMERTSATLEMPKDIAYLKAQGLTDDIRRTLVSRGIVSVDTLAATPDTTLCALPDIGLRLARRLIAAARAASKAEIPKDLRAAAAAEGMPSNSAAPQKAVPLFPDGEGKARAKRGDALMT